MKPTLPLLGRVLALLLCLAAAPAAATTIVRFGTPLGDIDVELSDDPTVQTTVQNFLKYVTDGDYVDSFIHRSAINLDDEPFVIQGGGFTFDGTFDLVPTDPPIVNQFSPTRSNVRGTIAMARSGAVNSATSQWFINLNDDNTFLDTSNEGFTVFGQVIGDGMDVADDIAALQRWNASVIDPALNEIPLIDYPGSGSIGPHLVFTDVQIVPEPTTALALGLGLALLGLRRR
jgi:peptidyl-prolyl cis-trans isomerase A (cyclophilin A)